MIEPCAIISTEANSLLQDLHYRKPVFFATTDVAIITQRGRAAAVLIGVKAYEKFEHEKELLMLLAKGDREIEVGEGYDLDIVLAEADALLAKEA